MPKATSVYICNECGGQSFKWYGKCPDCGSWNSITEQPAETSATSKKVAAAFGKLNMLSIDEIPDDAEIRYLTDIGELNRVLGGGIVRGSAILLAGDPGIGKSTLLLQICGPLSAKYKIMYFSGEESARQIKLRASRLGVTGGSLYVASDMDVQRVVETTNAEKPDIVIIDSIQTMNHTALSSSPGSVTQVRECTQLLVSAAKSNSIAVFIVGHVNKDGGIAGPKVLEHMVDAVLHFEGERHLSYRILRAIKNRYGSTNEIGVFEMHESGLTEVPNPSLAMVSGRPENATGSCIACVMEGSRPILTEIQALVTKTAFGMPRRMSTGFDQNRLALLLAVLEKRSGFSFATLDAYINVVGGLRLNEPAADLPVAMALVSNLFDKPINKKIAAFGEIGLAGEIRAVSNVQARVAESYRLGFTKCLIPKTNLPGIKAAGLDNLEIIGVSSIHDVVNLCQNTSKIF